MPALPVDGRRAKIGLPDDLETQLERKLQQASGHYQPHCAQCTLAMHRHRQIMELTVGAAAYWRDQVLTAGRQYWTTGEVADRTTFPPGTLQSRVAPAKAIGDGLVGA